MTNKFGDDYSAFSKIGRRKTEQLSVPGLDISVLRNAPPLLTPKCMFLVLGGAIFITDIIIMILLAYVPVTSVVLEALLDATTLLLVFSPAFYFIQYRPLQAYFNDRKKIVEKLFHSEERLTLALNAVNDGLWDWNVLSGEVYMSSRSSTMLGFQPGELGDKMEDWGARLHPEDREEVDRLLKEHLEGGNTYYRAVHRLQHKDGDYLWVLARGQVVARSADTWPLRMIGTFTDITLRKQAEEALRRSEADIRNLSRKLMNKSENEKKHLAQDLHDEFGQVLCAFQLGVEMLRDHNYGPPDQYQAQCDRLLSLVERLEVDLRHMCDHLRPVILDDLGLVSALKWHLEQFANRHPEVETSFCGTEQKISMSHEKEIACYRICQEALNNVAKHAEASLVDVELQLDEGLLRLSIRDNGVGFDGDEVRCTQDGWGLGLLGMRERAAAVGGDMHIESTQGQGTLIEVTLSLEETEKYLDEEVCA
ncbi:PAS domain-containing sensor histidine kinase [Geopsychrobacter electrodiphilus]|uniref:PAS domain-containing sensor histidine kinase n=1 Tax=Geopsychrobacter electrodiphilus TaxID=225196 RepID=UPI0012EB876B|nr:PAS domain-containing protein [Geopsychrobacter electrodiphilus]